MWFLPSCNNNLLVTGFEPSGTITQFVIVVPSFAEEMNKSRKVASDFARAMASKPQSSTAVYLIDLFGCGDSEGLLIDATWQTWRRNVLDLVSHIRGENPHANCVLLGVRLGSALALDCVLTELAGSKVSLLFWQPTLNGSQFINQFFRMKIAASMMAHQKLTMAQLREDLAAANEIEVGGYTLSQTLAREIEQLDFHQLEALSPNLVVAWFEIGLAQSTKLLPISEKVIARWQQQNRVTSDYFSAQPFWQSVEIITVPELVERSVSYLSGQQA